MTNFEEATGAEFTHIRLLARAFTDRSLGMSNLTMGSNQRLEFLGDTVLQLVTSDYLYRHFPEHHEGHLSLLRSSVVNNRTQAVVADDLGIPDFASSSNPRRELKVKDRADLLEAYIGALYVDKDLSFCKTFAEVCFFPRLRQFILNQEWNDPKSKLQQCCLTLRQMNGREPDIPAYKVTECRGPTNTRVYGVVVYFRGKRLAKAQGQSIQEAEMNAARRALKDNGEELFPHLSYQKAIVERSFLQQGAEAAKEAEREKVLRERRELGLDKAMEEKERKWKEKLEGLSKEERKKVLLEEVEKKRAEVEEQKRAEAERKEAERKAAWEEKRQQQRKMWLEQMEKDREEWLKRKGAKDEEEKGEERRNRRDVGGGAEEGNNAPLDRRQKQRKLWLDQMERDREDWLKRKGGMEKEERGRRRRREMSRDRDPIPGPSRERTSSSPPRESGGARERRDRGSNKGREERRVSREGPGRSGSSAERPSSPGAKERKERRRATSSHRGEEDWAPPSKKKRRPSSPAPPTASSSSASSKGTTPAKRTPLPSPQKPSPPALPPQAATASAAGGDKEEGECSDSDE